MFYQFNCLPNESKKCNNQLLQVKVRLDYEFVLVRNVCYKQGCGVGRLRSDSDS